MAATRTHIYLTDAQRAGLEELRRRDRKTLTALVREAVDLYLEARLGSAGSADDRADPLHSAIPGP